MIELRGIIFLIFSLALIYSGTVFYNIPMVMAGGIFISYFAIYSLRFNSKIDNLSVEIKREFDLKSAPVGTKINYKVTIPKNLGYDFILSDILPSDILAEGEKNIDTKKYKTDVLSNFYELSLTIGSQKRGLFPIGPTKIVFKDGLNFFSRKKILDNKEHALFYLTSFTGKKLDIFLRKKVSEFTQGLRRSYYRGVGTNFIDLRDYAPGDDIRLIDWKTTAKNGKIYVKEFEEEKRQRVLILLDTDPKMFAGSKKIIMDSAIKAAMAISHIALNHGDYLGCAVFSDKIKDFLKFNVGKKQYKKLIKVLSSISSGEKTNIKFSLGSLKSIFKKNSLIIIISTLTNKEESIAAIRKLRANGNNIIVLYPFEPLFSFESANTRLEKIIIGSLEEKFRLDAWKIKNRLKKISVPLLAAGPDDFEEKLIKQYVKTINKNLRLIYS